MRQEKCYVLFVKLTNVGFEAVTVVVMKSTGFGDVSPCSVI
jgi:hypothetical protein